MRRLAWGFLGLFTALVFTGCQRSSYTEADVRDAIEERQAQMHIEIERSVRAAPPVEVETPPANSAPSSKEGTAPNPGGVELPPPNRYDTPAPRPTGGDTPVQSPPAVGDVKLDPRTGQYGIQPPGAPETYTIPLDRQQGQ
ncbi:MAG: hypothetical protein NZM28_07615 [Fimbriimonadales bacterium]|nr:hypothetical protein [Fimbriimonadales bacterium]